MSTETAVRFQPCRIADRIAAEREFISSLYGTEVIHWTEEMHFTSFDLQSVWLIKLADGTQLHVYFETEGTIYD